MCSRENNHIITRLTCLVSLLVLGAACSLESAVEVDDPDSERAIHYKHIVTHSTALGLYVEAISSLRDAVNDKSQEVAIFTDELTLSTALSVSYWVAGDARKATQGSDEFIKGLNHRKNNNLLHRVRVTANHARIIMQRLDNPALAALVAGTYAIEGYSILMLAEDNCSGIPLTEVPFEGEIIYGEGLSTNQLFRTAVAKFDSALAIQHDSADILTLARMGLGRAYLGLGEYGQAANAVIDVKVSDIFYVDFQASPINQSVSFSFWTGNTQTGGVSILTLLEIVNREGMNGMVWFSDPNNIDPRVPVNTRTVDEVRTFPEVVRQQKFTGGTLQFPLARGVEALMIRAENALNNGNAEWRYFLNEARATVGLPALSDPVEHNDRIDMLFKERAFWFYLEGVRLADFRRLVRQYGRSPHLTYPVGPYTRSNTGEVSFYGEAWVFMPSEKEEMTTNPKYTGCFHTQP